MKQRIAKQIEQLFKTKIAVEITRPEPQFGDYSTNVALQLAPKLKQNPRAIAGQLADWLRTQPELEQVAVAGAGFINWRISNLQLQQLATASLPKVRDRQIVVIETNNPNPFKAMHIGHAMNAIVADTLANLLQASGAQTHRVSYHGDVGAHVGKSMWAFLKFLDGDFTKLQNIDSTKRNQLMSQMYAEGARAYKQDPTAKAEIDELTRQSFTQRDPFYKKVYQTIFDWSFAEIAANLKQLGNQPTEQRFLESQTEVRGVQIVRDHTPAVFEQSDGALIFRGSNYGGFDNAFVSSGGQGLYAARDLGLMQLKNEAFHPDQSFIVTAEEQKDYFKGVFAAANLALPELKNQTINITTGTVKLATGKMSSRDGDVITIDWLFEQIAQAVKARGAQPDQATITGALRYAFLKVRIGSDIIFDINESVSIQGNSGPYLQYAHARACSILAKSKTSSTDLSQLDDAERQFLLKLSQFNEVAERAMCELLPHLIANYLYELAQQFNRFYENSRIIGDPRQDIRLYLVQIYQQILERGLSLLGIDAPQKI